MLVSVLEGCRDPCGFISHVKLNCVESVVAESREQLVDCEEEKQVWRCGSVGGVLALRD